MFSEQKQKICSKRCSVPVLVSPMQYVQILLQQQIMFYPALKWK